MDSKWLKILKKHGYNSKKFKKIDIKVKFIYKNEIFNQQDMMYSSSPVCWTLIYTGSVFTVPYEFKKLNKKYGNPNSLSQLFFLTYNELEMILNQLGFKKEEQSSDQQ
jgi:hypothetical protein